MNARNKKIASRLLPVLVVAVLYLTGLHVTVISYAQRGILATGLFTPELSPSTDRPSSTGPAYSTRETLNFRMTDPAGLTVDARSLAGKVVFVNLWASWCSPCLAEMPSIAALWRDYASDERIAFVLLNTEADFSKGLDYVGRQGYGFPVYQLSGGLPPALSTSSLPTTFVIAPSGEVVVDHRGMASYDTEEFRDFLDSLLE